MLITVFDSRKKLFTAVVTSLFVLFVVMLPRYTDTAKTWFVLLLLTALGYLILNLKQLKDTTLLERTFFTVVIFNFMWIAFTFYINGEPGRGASFLWGRHFYFLFLIPLFFMFRRIEIPDKLIVLALLVSILVSLTDILIDIAQGIDHRLQGMNPNAFGPIQLCMSGILLFYFIKRPESLMRWLALAGFLFGIANVVFSKSRSTWLTLAVLSIFFVIYLSRSQSAWKRIAVITAITLMFFGSYLLPIVKARVDKSIVNINNYLATDDYRDASRSTSIGVRLELWKTGWHIFLENPLLGVGVGGFKPAARANSERYQVNEAVHRFKYVHNQYIASLATRGIPGLVLLLLILCLPIYIAMSQKAIEHETGFVHLSIVLVCMNYVIGNLAEDHFEGKSATMFISVILALLLARISPGRGRQASESNS